jgi:hypothetical protein
MLKWLNGEIPRASNSKFRWFLRRLGIPVRRFGRAVRPPKQPPTRFGRILMPQLRQRGLTISKAARQAGMVVQRVWQWIYRGSVPHPDDLRLFLARNGLDPTPFERFLARGRKSGRDTAFSRYLREERDRQNLTWKKFVALFEGSGIAYSQLWKWDRGRTIPTPAAAERLLTVLKTAEPMRTRLLEAAGRQPVETAGKRTGVHPRATCRICDRKRPWHTVAGSRRILREGAGVHDVDRGEDGRFRAVPGLEPGDYVTVPKSSGYDPKTNTFEHPFCRRRLRAWLRLRRQRHIPGLQKEDCERFAATGTVPVVCLHPDCGGVPRPKTVRALYLYAGRWKAKRGIRHSRSRCEKGILVQACERHARHPLTKETIPSFLREILKRVILLRVLTNEQANRLVKAERSGDPFAVARIDRIESEKGKPDEHRLAAGIDRRDDQAIKEAWKVWSTHALSFRRSKPKREGTTRRRTLAGVLRGLRQRRFDPCRWCGLVVSRPRGRSPADRLMYHADCNQTYRHSPEYKERWLDMLQEPERLASVEHDLRTGRWRRRGGNSQLAGYFKGLSARVWWRRGRGRPPGGVRLQLGCEAFILRGCGTEVGGDVISEEVRPDQAEEALHVFTKYAAGDWRLILPGLSRRGYEILRATCPLPPHGEDRRALVQDLAERRMRRDAIARLTGVPLDTVHATLDRPEAAHANRDQS